ncbi:MAG: SGNH/GDSL hydrolase family protein [Janthinobacterium lividum]
MIRRFLHALAALLIASSPVLAAPASSLAPPVASASGVSAAQLAKLGPNVTQRAPGVNDDFSAGFRAYGDIYWVNVTKGSSTAYGTPPTVTFSGCTTNPTGHVSLDITGQFVSAVLIDTKGVCYAPGQGAPNTGTYTIPTVTFAYSGGVTPTTPPVGTATMVTTPMEWLDPKGNVWTIDDSTPGAAAWSVLPSNQLPADVVPYTIQTLAVNAGGAGYAVNDPFTATDGTVGKVVTVSSGAVTAVSLTTPAVTQCRPTSVTGVATTTTGSGTGLTINETYNGPNGAWGMVKVTACYTGPLVDVLRLTDIKKITVGMDATGRADETVLCPFLGGTTGVITRGYEQTGLAASGVGDIPDSGVGQRPAVRCDLRTGRILQITNANIAGGIGYPDAVATNTGALNLPAAFVNTSTKTAFGMLGRMNQISSIITVSQGGLGSTSDNGGNYRCFINAGQVAPLSWEGPLTNAAVFIMSGAPTGTDGVCNNGGTGIVSGYGNASGSGGTVLTSGAGSAFSALVFFNTPGLTLAQRMTLQASFTSMSGIFPQVRDVLHCQGDSMTAGTGSTLAQIYCGRSEAVLTTPMRIYFDGGSGQTTSTRYTGAFDTTTRARYMPNNGRFIEFLLAGFNDVNQSITGAQSWATHQQYWTTIHGFGANVRGLDATIPHSSANGASSITVSQGGAYNALLASAVVGLASSPDAYINMTGTPGQPLAVPNPSGWFVDGTHPTDRGEWLFASTLGTGVNALNAR